MDWSVLIGELEKFAKEYEGTEHAGVAAEKAKELVRMLEMGWLDDDEEDEDGE